MHPDSIVGPLSWRMGVALLTLLLALLALAAHQLLRQQLSQQLLGRLPVELVEPLKAAAQDQLGHQEGSGDSWSSNMNSVLHDNDVDSWSMLPEPADGRYAPEALINDEAIVFLLYGDRSDELIYCCPGLVTAIYSLRRVGTSRRVLLLATDRKYAGDPVLAWLGVELRLVPATPTPKNKCVGAEHLSKSRLGHAFTKLHLWSLKGFKNLVYLDSDTLLLHPVDDIFTLMEGVPQPDLLGIVRTCGAYCTSGHTFSRSQQVRGHTGLMAIRPSANFGQRLLRYMIRNVWRCYTDEERLFGDVFAQAFEYRDPKKQKVICLDRGYNCNCPECHNLATDDETMRRTVNSKAKMHVLHWAGEAKPWKDEAVDDPPSSFVWRRIWASAKSMFAKARITSTKPPRLNPPTASPPIGGVDNDADMECRSDAARKEVAYFHKSMQKPRFVSNKADFSMMRAVAVALKAIPGVCDPGSRSYLLIAGTNEGQSTENMRTVCPEINIRGYEIQQDVFGRVTYRFIQHPNIIILQKGLSDKRGKTKVSGSGEKAGIYKSFGGFKEQEGYEVELVLLAEERKASGIKTFEYFVLDVEGAEPMAIRGMKLQEEENRHAWPLFQIEMKHGPWDQRLMSDWTPFVMCKYLHGLGYEIYLMGVESISSEGLSKTGNDAAAEPPALLRLVPEFFEAYTGQPEKLNVNVLVLLRDYARPELVSVVDKHVEGPSTVCSRGTPAPQVVEPLPSLEEVERSHEKVEAVPPTPVRSHEEVEEVEAVPPTPVRSHEEVESCKKDVGRSQVDYFHNPSNQPRFVSNKADFAMMRRVALHLKTLPGVCDIGSSSYILIAGTNEGQSTENMRKACPKIQIRGFEIQEAVFQRVTKRFAEHPNIVIQQKGLADKHGRTKVSGSGEKAGIYKSFDRFKEQEGYDVELVLLAEERKRLGIDRFEYFVLDVEGAEPMAIRGMRLDLEENRQAWPLFQIEMKHGPWDQRLMNDWPPLTMCERLQGWGYEIYLMGINSRGDDPALMHLSSTFFSTYRGPPEKLNINVIALNRAYARAEMTSLIDRFAEGPHRDCET